MTAHAHVNWGATFTKLSISLCSNWKLLTVAFFPYWRTTLNQWSAFLEEKKLTDCFSLFVFLSFLTFLNVTSEIGLRSKLQWLPSQRIASWNHAYLFCLNIIVLLISGWWCSQRGDRLHRNLSSHHIGGGWRKRGWLLTYQTWLPPWHQRISQLRGSWCRHQLLHGADGQSAAGWIWPAPRTAGPSRWVIVIRITILQ